MQIVADGTSQNIVYIQLSRTLEAPRSDSMRPQSVFLLCTI